MIATDQLNTRANAILALLLQGRESEALALFESMSTPQLEALLEVTETLHATLIFEIDERSGAGLPETTATAEAADYLGDLHEMALFI